MSFLIIGKGTMNEAELRKHLEMSGVTDPHAVIRQAAKGRAICDGLIIALVR
jgi:hypothetical protein